jgi:hypothetical protein
MDGDRRTTGFVVRSPAPQWRMPALTRRRSTDAREDCWHIYYGDVHAGTVCWLIANHLHLTSFESALEVRAFCSAVTARPQRSYDPVRLPPWPPPVATLRPPPSQTTGLPRARIGPNQMGWPLRRSESPDIRACKHFARARGALAPKIPPRTARESRPWPSAGSRMGLRPPKPSRTDRSGRVFDRSDVTYPLLAITLAARRDNLRDTLAVFEQRLATIKAPPVEPVAA